MCFSLSVSGVSAPPGRDTLAVPLGKGVSAAPDYKSLYLELFRANEQAVQLLQNAQVRAEAHLLEADLPPIRLEEEKKPPLTPEGSG